MRGLKDFERRIKGSSIWNFTVSDLFRPEVDLVRYSFITVMIPMSWRVDRSFRHQISQFLPFCSHPTMPASLDSLSPELIDIIVWNLFTLDIDASLAPYATISHPFQLAVERITFGRVYVPSGSHQKLCEIGAHPWRKRSLRSLAYDIDLPRYPTSRRYKKERRKEHKANLKEPATPQKYYYTLFYELKFHLTL